MGRYPIFAIVTDSTPDIPLVYKTYFVIEPRSFVPTLCNILDFLSIINNDSNIIITRNVFVNSWSRSYFKWTASFLL